MADPKAGEEVKAPTATNDVPNLDEKKDPPARTYSQEEVDRIATKVRRNAARDAELRLRRETATTVTPAEEPKPPKEDVEPKRDDFETFEDHQRALAAFEGRKAAREERQERKGRREAALPPGAADQGAESLVGEDRSRAGKARRLRRSCWRTTRRRSR
jgi:hypothetical protein